MSLAYSRKSNKASSCSRVKGRVVGGNYGKTGRSQILQAMAKNLDFLISASGSHPSTNGFVGEVI